MCKNLAGESVERERVCIENKEKDQKMKERKNKKERTTIERGDIEREHLHRVKNESESNGERDDRS
jgi:hypothetical protein